MGIMACYHAMIGFNLLLKKENHTRSAICSYIYSCNKFYVSNVS